MTGTRGKRVRLEFVAVLLGAVLALSLSSVFIKHLERIGLPLLGIAALRMATVSLVLVATRLARGTGHRKTSPSEWVLTTISGLLLAIHFGTWTVSLGKISIARSVLLVSTHPIFTALGESLLLGQKLRFRGGVGIGLAIAGIGIMVAGSESLGGSTLVGDLLALAGAVTLAGYFLLGRRLRGQMPLLPYITPLYFIAALTLVTSAVAAGQWMLPRSALAWALVGGLALFPTFLGHVVMSWAIRHLPATAISTSFLGEAVGAAILAWVFFGQIPSSGTWIGGTITLAGIYCVLTVGARSRLSG